MNPEIWAKGLVLLLGVSAAYRIKVIFFLHSKDNYQRLYDANCCQPDSYTFKIGYKKEGNKNKCWFETNKNALGSYFIKIDAIVIYLQTIRDFLSEIKADCTEEKGLCLLIYWVIEHETLHKCLCEHTINVDTHHAGINLIEKVNEGVGK